MKPSDRPLLVVLILLCVGFGFAAGLWLAPLIYGKGW